ncbi:hydrolase or metal-binding protein [Marinobacteraceae bacterium S3BR75-40.1]
MIKGLAITPPVLGRISIGRVVEKNGIRLPQKDNQFTITTQVQDRGGEWILHPWDETLRKASRDGKIRVIPIRLLFNDPELNLRAEYTMFDRKTGRPICIGNGESCRRATSSGVEALACPGPTLCEFGKGGLCKPYGRLNVRIGDEDDELGTFIFRTTGYNSIRTLAARLRYYQAVSGSLLAYLPLEMRLRGKSTTQSHRTPIYYVDLGVRDDQTMAEAIALAREQAEKRKASGFNQQALDEVARKGLENANFEESDDDVGDILEEFYPESTGKTVNTELQRPTENIEKIRELKSKLAASN